MAQMYFYKFNINAEIYNVYKDDALQDKILNDVFAKINNDMSYVYGFEDDENDKPTEYKFCDLMKDPTDLTITGRLVKIYDGEVERYDRERDTVTPTFEEDQAASATFFFDVLKEEIAFITRQGLGYQQFGKYFTKLLETKYQEGSFELVLEKNVGELKKKIYSLNRVIKVSSMMVPPNANEAEFENLLGATVDEFKETGATKYIQKMEISSKGNRSINAQTKFFQRMLYAVGKGYANMNVEGRNHENVKVVIDSDEDTPYKDSIPDNEKDSLGAFKERANISISKLLVDKASVSLRSDQTDEKLEE